MDGVNWGTCQLSEIALICNRINVCAGLRIPVIRFLRLAPCVQPLTDLADLWHREISHLRLPAVLSMVSTETVVVLVMLSVTMQYASRHSRLSCFVAAVLCLSGCTSLSDYVHNGFKVGPNYCGAKAAVAPGWIDSTDLRVRSHAAALSRWWTIFNDPVLNDLIVRSYNQNINLKEYGTRILQARHRADLAIVRGDLFRRRKPLPAATTSGWRLPGAQLTPGLPQFSNQWNFGFNLDWELDFWGQFRRAVLAAQANLDGSWGTMTRRWSLCWLTYLSTTLRCVRPRNGSNWLATMWNYLDVLNIVQARFRVGTANELDVDQAQTTLYQTAATIPAFEVTLRQSQDRLCTLLGIPPTNLEARWDGGRSPRSGRRGGGNTGAIVGACSQRPQCGTGRRGTSPANWHR